MSIEKMRESFEAWAITSAWLGLVGDDLEFIDGGYVYPEVQSAWLSWQASRAAIEVDLPESASIHNTEVIKAVGRHIIKQGLRIKQ